MISVICNDNDITGMVSKVDWSGEGLEVARKCDITYANAPYDPNVKDLLAPKAGDYITVYSDGTELFYGRVTGSEKSSSYGTLTANCVEDSQILSKCKVKYSFTNKTAEEISRLILADYEFPVGDLVETGINIKSYVVDKKSIYEAIKGAYEEAAKQTNESYLIRMSGHALCVEISGTRMADIVISEATNITESSYTEKLDSLVNKVIIYDKKGNRIGEVSDSDSMSKYGTYQEIYTQTDNDTDVQKAAKEQMKEPEQSLSVTALGDISATGGAGIKLSDSATGQYGLYWIKNDKHTFENGQHTMTLELSFKKLTTEDD